MEFEITEFELAGSNCTLIAFSLILAVDLRFGVFALTTCLQFTLYDWTEAIFNLFKEEMNYVISQSTSSNRQLPQSCDVSESTTPVCLHKNYIS